MTCPDGWLGLIASAIQSLGLASGIPAKWVDGHVLISRIIGKPRGWPSLALLRVTRGFCAGECESQVSQTRFTKHCWSLLNQVPPGDLTTKIAAVSTQGYGSCIGLHSVNEQPG